MNRGRIQEFTGTGMVCSCSMMSIAPSSKTQLTEETRCRDAVGGEQKWVQDRISDGVHIDFSDSSAKMMDKAESMWGLPGWSAGSISCRWLCLPAWAWLQREATPLLLKSDSFHKEETVLEWCLLPFWQDHLGKVSMGREMSFRRIWKVCPQRLCVCLCHLQNYAGHYRQATKRWSHDFQWVHPRVRPTLPGEKGRTLLCQKPLKTSKRVPSMGCSFDKRRREK